jgi:hypothetical protein
MLPCVQAQSDRARLVDLWIESCVLVSADSRMDRRCFDRTTRQNLKKMRPGSAQVSPAALTTGGVPALAACAAVRRPAHAL